MYAAKFDLSALQYSLSSYCVSFSLYRCNWGALLPAVTLLALHTGPWASVGVGFPLGGNCHLQSGCCQVSKLPVIPGGQAAVRMLWHLSTGFSLLGGLKSKISCINFQSDGGFLRFQGQEKSDVYPLQGFSIWTAFALCRDLLPSSSLSFKRLIGVIRAACWNCQEHDMLKRGTMSELGSSSPVLGKQASYY